MLKLRLLLSSVLSLFFTFQMYAVGVYVPNLNSDDVSVINIATNQEITRIGVGNGPFYAAVTPDNTKVYVAHASEAAVYVINATANTLNFPISNIPVGSISFFLSITPNGEKVYVSNNTTNSVSVIDVATDTLSGPDIPVGSSPTVSTVTPNGQKVFVVNSASSGGPGGTVHAIDVSTDTATPISVGDNPYFVAVTPDSAKAYVSGTDPAIPANGYITIIDVATNGILANLSTLTPNPQQILVHPNGQTVYVVHNISIAPGGKVTVIDVASNTVTTTMPAGLSSWSMALTPDGQKLYVSNKDDPNITVYNTATNTLITTISLPIGSQPFNIAVSPDGQYGYVVDVGGANAVRVIDIATDTLLAPISVGTTPVTLSFAGLQLTDMTVWGKCGKDSFLSQVDLYNMISWSTPNWGFIDPPTVACYKIYRDAALTDLAGVVPGNVFRFEDHNRKPKRTYTYYVIAENIRGGPVAIGTISVHSCKK